jgi:hypothetical protein
VFYLYYGIRTVNYDIFGTCSFGYLMSGSPPNLGINSVSDKHYRTADGGQFSEMCFVS